MASGYIDLPVTGGGSGSSGVSSINSLSGALTLVAGSGITITSVGTVLTVSTNSNLDGGTANTSIVPLQTLDGGGA